MDPKKLEQALWDTFWLEGALKDDAVSTEKVRRLRAILRQVAVGL